MGIGNRPPAQTWKAVTGGLAGNVEDMTGGIDLHAAASAVGNENAIHKRHRLDTMVLSVADEIVLGRRRLRIGRPAVGGSMPRFRRPEKPSPPATTSTRSNVLIVRLGISRTKSAGLAAP